MANKDGRDLVTEAVKDAKALREASVEAAKNELIESMVPGLRQFVDRQIRRGTLKKEDTDRLRRGITDNAPGESHTGFEESTGRDKGEQHMGKELDMESLSSFFPTLGEEEEMEKTGGEGGHEEELEKESSIATLGEGDEEEGGEKMHEGEEMDEKKEKEGEEMDEDIEISEAELRKVYEAALQTEATVSKNFSEMSKSGELDEVDPGAGIVDVKKGEHNWEKETPPAKQDFTVKEAIKLGMAENKKLREHLGRAVAIISKLGGKLHEVNLFNAKVLHVNRILNRHGRLTTEQKKVVLESIDKACSIKQVQMVYETIVSSFKSVGALQESRVAGRNPKANAQKHRTSGEPKQEVLRESADRAANNDQFARMRKLAGIVSK